MPNMPGAVPRTSTWALTNVTVPYAAKIAEHGLAAAARADTALMHGVNTYDGSVTYAPVAQANGLEYVSARDLLG